MTTRIHIGGLQMSCPEEVEKVFSAHQRFEIAGAPVDIWEPPDPDNSSDITH